MPRHVVFAKLTESVRRNELLVLASLLAGLVMALFLMTITWVTGTGLWAFPGYVAALAFRSLQTGATLTFAWPQIAAGLGIHLAVTLVMGGLFAWASPRLRQLLGLENVAETSAYGIVGLGFGFGVFAVAWYGVLPYVNPVMVRGLDPTFFAIAHGVWGLCLGVTRKAWTQETPYARRSSTSASPQPTPAASSHKAPSQAASGPASAHAGASAGGEIATLEPDEDEDVEAEASEPDEETDPVETATSGDELSPWPAPPDPDDEDEADSDDGYASSSSSTTTSSSSSSASSDDEEDEDDGLAMTEHARRSLRGLTDREPDLPPVHKALQTTLTHVAPGRAVCTIDADERLHDATGAVQSGLLISLAELAATIAMETVAPEAEHATVASEVQIEGFVEEGHVVAEAEVTEVAGTTTLAEAEVRDATGQVLVKASFQAVTDDE